MEFPLDITPLQASLRGLRKAIDRVYPDGGEFHNDRVMAVYDPGDDVLVLAAKEMRSHLPTFAGINFAKRELAVATAGFPDTKSARRNAAAVATAAWEVAAEAGIVPPMRKVLLLSFTKFILETVGVSDLFYQVFAEWGPPSEKKAIHAAPSLLSVTDLAVAWDGEVMWIARADDPVTWPLDRVAFERASLGTGFSVVAGGFGRTFPIGLTRAAAVKGEEVGYLISSLWKGNLSEYELALAEETGAPRVIDVEGRLFVQAGGRIWAIGDPRGATIVGPEGARVTW